MSDLRKAAEMALEALEQTPTVNKLFDSESYEKQKDAIDALRQALAQPDNDAMKTMLEKSIEVNNNLFDGMQTLFDYQKLCNREWVGLTDDEVYEIYGAVEKEVGEHWGKGGTTMMFPTSLYRAIEAKLKEKNT